MVQGPQALGALTWEEISAKGYFVVEPYGCRVKLSGNLARDALSADGAATSDK